MEFFRAATLISWRPCRLTILASSASSVRGATSWRESRSNAWGRRRRFCVRRATIGGWTTISARRRTRRTPSDRRPFESATRSIRRTPWERAGRRDGVPRVDPDRPSPHPPAICGSSPLRSSGSKPPHASGRTWSARCSTTGRFPSSATVL